MNGPTQQQLDEFRLRLEALTTEFEELQRHASTAELWGLAVEETVVGLPALYQWLTSISFQTADADAHAPSEVTRPLHYDHRGLQPPLTRA
jgi:hypothetical protein